jgi:hypothetical protein
MAKDLDAVSSESWQVLIAKDVDAESSDDGMTSTCQESVEPFRNAFRKDFFYDRKVFIRVCQT